MKISPDNPHLQALKTILYHEALTPLDFHANAKNIENISMSPSNYRASVREFPFMTAQDQLAFIMNWRE
jgi:hypothetical protein